MQQNLRIKKITKILEKYLIVLIEMVYIALGKGLGKWQMFIKYHCIKVYVWVK